jgi:hypothetical protein
MPELNIDIPFSIYCSHCGAGLCNDTTIEYGRNGSPKINVVCHRCREQAFDDGYEEGLEYGYQKGIKEIEQE